MLNCSENAHAITCFVGAGPQVVRFHVSTEALAEHQYPTDGYDYQDRKSILDGGLSYTIRYLSSASGITGRLIMVADPEAENSARDFLVKLDVPRGMNAVTPIDLFRISICREQPVGAGLVLDLGNTRSFALVIDRLSLPGYVGRFNTDLLALSLGSLGENENGGKAEEEGVFPSLGVMEWAPITPDHDAISFLRFGVAAESAERSILGFGPVGGRYCLSSLKRYFWQEDPESGTDWKCWAPEGSPQVGPLDNWLANTLAGHYEVSTKNLPRCVFLITSVIELIEQAEAQLNSWNHMEKSGKRAPRNIQHLEVLFPASWTRAQVNQYRHTIQQALDQYTIARSRNIPINLSVNCDEATAVMLTYTYSEIRKYADHGQNWVRAVGKYPDQPVTRIAVADIGGGTSDLVIADLTDLAAEGGVNLEVKTIYRHGANHAGDAFLHNVVEDIVLPSVGEFLFQQKELRNHFYSLLKEDMHDSSQLRERRARWVRTLWYPLALMVTNYADNQSGETKGEMKIDEGWLLTSMQDFLSQFRAHIQDHVPGHESVMRQLLPPVDPPFFLPIPADLRRCLDRIAKKTLVKVARSFGAAVSSFDVDLLLLAGKASEISGIRYLFESHIPLPQQRIIHLAQYYTGEWCPFAKNGFINDAKIMTVLGGVLFALSEQDSQMLGTSYNIQTDRDYLEGAYDEHHYWGQISEASRVFAHALFEPGDIEKIIQFRGRMLIGRRSVPFVEHEADPTYELRLSPKLNDRAVAGRTVADEASVTLKKNVDRNSRRDFDIVNVDGRFRDGTLIRVEDLDLRMCCLIESDYWLDSGDLTVRADV